MLDSLRPDNWDKRWWIYPVACFGAVYLGYWVLRTPNTGAAILAGVVFALICLAFVTQNHEDRKFLVRLFLGALCARWAVGIFIDSYPLMRPLVGDAYTYDAVGAALSQSWQGIGDSHSPWLVAKTNIDRSGWGMFYYVAAIYYIVGQNMLAAAFVTASLGASTAVVVYKIVMLLFDPSALLARRLCWSHFRPQ
jgi:hypothetical protein